MSKVFTATKQQANATMRQAEFDAAVTRLAVERNHGKPPWPAIVVARAIGISPTTACSRQWKPIFDKAREGGLVQTIRRTERR